MSLPSPVAEATAAGFRADLVESGSSAATVNNRLAALRSVVREAKRLGLVGWTLEVRGVTAGGDVRPGLGSRRLRGLARLRRRRPAEARGDRRFSRLLHDLGLRPREISALDMADLDAAAGTLRVLCRGRRIRKPCRCRRGRWRRDPAWRRARRRAGPPLQKLRAGVPEPRRGRAVEPDEHLAHRPRLWSRTRHDRRPRNSCAGAHDGRAGDGRECVPSAALGPVEATRRLRRRTSRTSKQWPATSHRSLKPGERGNHRDRDAGRRWPAFSCAGYDPAHEATPPVGVQRCGGGVGGAVRGGVRAVGAEREDGRSGLLPLRRTPSMGVARAVGWRPGGGVGAVLALGVRGRGAMAATTAALVTHDGHSNARPCRGTDEPGRPLRIPLGVGTLPRRRVIEGDLRPVSGTAARRRTTSRHPRRAGVDRPPPDPPWPLPRLRLRPPCHPRPMP